MEQEIFEEVDLVGKETEMMIINLLKTIAPFLIMNLRKNKQKIEDINFGENGLEIFVSNGEKKKIKFLIKKEQLNKILKDSIFKIMNGGKNE